MSLNVESFNSGQLKQAQFPYIDSLTPIVIIADVIDALKEIPESFIDVIVTSPPYWGQRDYGCSDELGKEENSSEYIKRLMNIAKELRRVLKDSGVFFLNIGDKYVNKDLEMIPERLAIEMKANGWAVRNKVIWHKTNPNPSPVKDRFNNTYEVIYMFVKNPDNYLTPEYHFDLDAVRIETKDDCSYKENGLPKYINIDDIEKYNGLIQKTEYNGKFKGQKMINVGASAGGRLSLKGEFYSRQRKHPISQSLKLEIIHFLRRARRKAGISTKEIDVRLNTSHTAGHWFRTDRGGSSLPSPEHWKKLKEIIGLGETIYDKVMTEEHYVLQTVCSHKRGKNPGDVWAMSTASLKEKHFAPFPDKLPEMCIKACCPVDGVVLDPFVGSGTTLKVANNLKRKSIGIDIAKQHLEIVEKVVGGSIKSIVL